MENQEKLDSSDIIRSAFKDVVQGISNLPPGLEQQLLNLAIAMSKCSGNIVTTGTGKSGLVAERISATWRSIGLSSYSLSTLEFAHGDIGAVSPEDLVVAISKSGKSDELDLLVTHARHIGAEVALITLITPKHLAGKIAHEVEIGPVEDFGGFMPTVSSTIFGVCGDAIAGLLFHDKGLTREEFSRYHQGGHLGHLLRYTVRDVMNATTNVAVIEETTPISAAAEVMNNFPIGAALVMRKEKLVGYVTDGDLRRFLQSNWSASEPRARDVMNATPIVVSAEHSLLEAKNLLTIKGKTFQTAPVEDRGSIVGIVCFADMILGL